MLILPFPYLLTEKHDTIDATPLVPNTMVTFDYGGLFSVKVMKLGKTGVSTKVCIEKAPSTGSTGQRPNLKTFIFTMFNTSDIKHRSVDVTLVPDTAKRAKFHVEVLD